MGDNRFAVRVKNDKGKSWDIEHSIIDNECVSASQYYEEQAVSQTEMIEILHSAGHRVFTAHFLAKPDKKAIIQQLKSLYPNKGIKGVGIAKKADYEKAVSAVINEVFDGRPRTMIGRILAIDSLRGRIQVQDLEIEKGHNTRLIDPRTLEWLILDGVKYVIK